MNLQIAWGLLILFLLMNTMDSFAQTDMFEITLRDAEADAIKTSERLKSFISEAEAVSEQANSLYSTLLPRLTLEGSYGYLGQVPNISLPGLPPVPFGSHWNYSIGPVLRYTFWDTGSSRKAYVGLSKLADSRREDSRNTELQLLLTVRTAYIRVELELEEFRLVNDSLEFARSQSRDINIRYRAGASTRLDLVTSRREVLNYELQFKQKQADLSSALKDLLALLGHNVKDISHPGPPAVDEVTLVLRLDSLKKLLADEREEEILLPGDRQPQIRAQELLAESSELSAASQKAQAYPTIQFSAKTSLDYPNGPLPEQINQNTVSVTLSMPLFEADRTEHLASEKLKEAQAARNREDQLRIDLQRDFVKAQALLSSLREQQTLAAQDVLLSEEAAKLYDVSYRAGKINLIDVQSANLQALQAKVNAARIDAQILNQLFTLKALSGGEESHER